MSSGNSFLIIGLSIIGFTTGYMIGVSSTPVVGTVVPLLFGMGMTFFGLLQPSKQLKELQNNIDNNKDKLQEIFTNIKEEISVSKKIIGLTLILFCSFYIFGTFVGAFIRINNPFVNNHKLVWTKENQPTKVSDTLDWIILQHNLETLGYSEKAIKSIYQIQILEWERKNNSIASINKQDDNKSSLKKHFIAPNKNIQLITEQKDLFNTKF